MAGRFSTGGSMPPGGIWKRTAVIAACVSFAVMPPTAAPAAAPNPTPPPAVQAKTSHPNIVILVADDWGFSDVGSFAAGYATRNIDALAHARVRFSNFNVSIESASGREGLCKYVRISG